MKCPHEWDDCSLCANERACIAGLYEPEQTDIDVLIKAAEVAEKVVDAEVRESAEKVRGTWAERFATMTEEERWEDWGKWQRQHVDHKTPIPLDGPVSPGGGSKSNKHKKPTKKQPEYLKTWGT